MYCRSLFIKRLFNGLLQMELMLLMTLLFKILPVQMMSLFSDYENSIDDSPYYQNCVCVPYWQCKEDYSGIVADGIDIIDIRMARDFQTPAPCTGDFDVCCQVECGRKNNGFLPRPDNNDMSLRILGDNSAADFGEFPWMLGILKDKVFQCGASLIHPQVALTAAHCITSSGNYKIRAGEWNWETREEMLPYQDRAPKKIIIHPHYHPGSLRNDVSLIIVDKPFLLAENVGIVCLPPQGLVFTNKRCIATGWGKNSHKKGTYQSTLKKIQLPIVPHETCLASLREARLGPYFNLHRSFICAGGEANKDTCKGDGGSPLVCPGSDQSGRYEQVGIVAWGLTCGLQNTPGVYVNVALFSDWIDKQMVLHNFDTKIYRIKT